MCRPKLISVLTAVLLGFVGLQPTNARAQNSEYVTCYTTHDSSYFYFGATVVKPALKGSVQIPFSNPLADDSIAVFLQAEDGSALPNRTNKSIEMAVSAAGGGQLYRGANATGLKGFQDFMLDSNKYPVSFKYQAVTRGKLNGAPGVDTGYSIELAIPWIELGGPPTPGTRMRFNVAAFSAAEGSPPFLSMSPQVHGPDDMQLPGLWGEIVFVDSPVKTLASAPNARICARVFNAKPLIDGVISDGEWNGVTSFSFGSMPASPGETVSLGARGTALRLAAIKVHAAPPPLPPPAPFPLQVPPSRSAQPLAHLVLAVYNYDYQNDSRKADASLASHSPNGETHFVSHPLGGEGPWFTTDDVSWHIYQFSGMRKAGIDAALAQYRADPGSRTAYSWRGLYAMVQALDTLSAHGSDYPTIGLYLDVTSLHDAAGSLVDLHTVPGQAVMYAAIKDFYSMVPSTYRLQIPLTPANGGGYGNVVALGAPGDSPGLTAAAVSYCRAHFEQEFGEDLVMVGDSRFPADCGLDGSFDGSHGSHVPVPRGWISIATASTLSSSQPFSAPDTELQSGWQQAVAARPTWVLQPTWNSYRTAPTIAATMEYGVALEDLNRTAVHQFTESPTGSGDVLHGNVPSTALPGEKITIDIRWKNNDDALWDTNQRHIDYAWTKVGTSGLEGAVEAPFTTSLVAGQAANISSQVTLPSAPGAYMLMGRIIGKTPGKTDLTGGGWSFVGAVTVTTAVPTWQVSIVRPGNRSVLQTGAPYPFTVTLRNDGSSRWPAGSTRVTARLLRYNSAINSNNEPESRTPVEMADATVQIPTDVAPGQNVDIAMPVTFAAPDGSPLAAWAPSDSWSYMLAWEVAPQQQALPQVGSLSNACAVQLVQSDVGGQFTADYTPSSIPAQRRLPVKLSIRNSGPNTWIKSATRLGYHWYYLDGVECIWEDETTPLMDESAPGSEPVDTLAFVTAPAKDGYYWLQWDVKSGDTWQSTIPGTVLSETVPHLVHIISGKLTQVDLTEAFNTDGISTDADRSDGDFDGAGDSLPGELLPPLASTPTAPSTLWNAEVGSGIDSSRAISFRWGSRVDGDKNCIKCVGQTVALAPKGSKGVQSTVVHILAASIGPQNLAGFTLQFADGTQQFTSFPVSNWLDKPLNNESVAMLLPRIHNRSAEVLRPANVYQYNIAVHGDKEVQSVQLTNTPDVRLLAITLER